MRAACGAAAIDHTDEVLVITAIKGNGGVPSEVASWFWAWAVEMVTAEFVMVVYDDVYERRPTVNLANPFACAELAAEVGRVVVLVPINRCVGNGTDFTIHICADGRVVD